jgi:hypothetical protein
VRGRKGLERDLWSDGAKRRHRRTNTITIPFLAPPPGFLNLLLRSSSKHNSPLAPLEEVIGRGGGSALLKNRNFMHSMRRHGPHGLHRKHSHVLACTRMHSPPPRYRRPKRAALTSSVALSDAQLYTMRKGIAKTNKGLGPGEFSITPR